VRTPAKPAFAPTAVNRGFVAGNLQATQRFAPWLLGRARRNVRATNFRKFVLGAALRVFPTSGHSIDIVDVVLARGRLAVHIVVHNPPPGAGVLFKVMTAYQVVRLPRMAVHCSATSIFERANGARS